MANLPCKEEECNSKSHQMTRPGSQLRAVVDAFRRKNIKQAFADASEERQDAIITTYDTHVARQKLLDAECEAEFQVHLDALRGEDD